MRARGEHWDDAYRAKSADQQSWFEASPDTSLALIERAAPGLSSRIVDIGGGASRLVDSLLARGYAVQDTAEGPRLSVIQDTDERG